MVGVIAARQSLAAIVHGIVVRLTGGKSRDARFVLKTVLRSGGIALVGVFFAVALVGLGFCVEQFRAVKPRDIFRDPQRYRVLLDALLQRLRFVTVSHDRFDRFIRAPDNDHGVRRRHLQVGSAGNVLCRAKCRNSDTQKCKNKRKAFHDGPL